MKTLIKNGRIVDPSQNLDAVMDLLIEDGVVKAIEKKITEKADETYDAKGLLVTPGLVDVHTHLREPGLEAKEDIVTGTKAAAAGGVTTIACMPNTKPVVDSSILVSGIKDRAAREGYVNVEVVGAITKGLEGKELAEMGDMAQKGAMAFSDDGHYVSSTRTFTLAAEYISAFDKILISHSIDHELASDGYMHEGVVSARIGVPGIPALAEDVAVARDILVAEYTGAHVHIAHVASKGAIELIRQAKKRGIPVTCEATVHHLTLTDEACVDYNTATRVSPPLRSRDHVEAIREALKDGTVDAIVTDHAPHAPEEKDVEFRYAPCGFCGLETSLGVILTELYHTNLFTINEIVGKMSTEPANIFSLNAGSLKVGKPADVTIIDLNKEWVVDSVKFYTRGKLTPFEGKSCKGKAVATMVAGKFVMRDGVVCTR
ncbi:MAG: dihydroorotase [Acidaminococcaceae bacterium]